MKGLISREQCALLFLCILIPGAITGLFMTFLAPRGTTSDYYSYYLAVLAAVIFGLGVLRDENKHTNLPRTKLGDAISRLADINDKTLFASSGISLHFGIICSIYSGACSRPATNLYAIVSGISIAILALFHFDRKASGGTRRYYGAIAALTLGILALPAYGLMSLIPNYGESYQMWTCRPSP